MRPIGHPLWLASLWHPLWYRVRCHGLHPGTPAGPWLASALKLVAKVLLLGTHTSRKGRGRFSPLGSEDILLLSESIPIECIHLPLLILGGL